MPLPPASRLRSPVAVLLIVASALGAVGIWMVYCRSRTRETFSPVVESLSLGSTRTEVEELLSPVCEAIVEQPTWSRYRCRQVGVGPCAHAPSMVLMVDLEFTSEGSEATQVLASIRRWDTGGLARSAQE